MAALVEISLWWATSFRFVTWFITCSLRSVFVEGNSVKKTVGFISNVFLFWLSMDRVKESVISILNDWSIATYWQRVFSILYSLVSMGNMEQSFNVERLDQKYLSSPSLNIIYFHSDFKTVNETETKIQSWCESLKRLFSKSLFGWELRILQNLVSNCLASELWLGLKLDCFSKYLELGLVFATLGRKFLFFL